MHEKPFHRFSPSRLENCFLQSDPVTITWFNVILDVAGICHHRHHRRWCTFFSSQCPFLHREHKLFTYFGQFGLLCCKMTHFLVQFWIMRLCPKIGKYQVRMTFDKAILFLRSNPLGVFFKLLIAIALWLEAFYTWWTWWTSQKLFPKMWNKGWTVVKPDQLESRKLGLQTNCHRYRILTANNKFTWPKSFHTPWARKKWVWRKKISFPKHIWNVSLGTKTAEWIWRTLKCAWEMSHCFERL